MATNKNKELRDKIWEMHADGFSLSEIGEEIGYKKSQTKRFLDEIKSEKKYGNFDTVIDTTIDAETDDGKWAIVVVFSVLIILGFSMWWLYIKK